MIYHLVSVLLYDPGRQSFSTNAFLKHLCFLFWICANFALLCSFLPFCSPQILFISSKREISAHYLRFLGLMLKSRACPCDLNLNLPDFLLYHLRRMSETRGLSLSSQTLAQTCCCFSMRAYITDLPCISRLRAYTCPFLLRSQCQFRGFPDFCLMFPVLILSN